ncbi:MAG: DUF3106 domain-containing protein [Candidatus Omnitrophica bacterium]|nr:DUF3106 domain-containing protein [Candidatus Omnitrophota bacterium]
MNNKRPRLSVFSFVLIATLACGIGYAGEDEMQSAGEDQTRPAQTPTEGQESVAGRGKVSPEALRRWQQLSPEQKQKLRGRLEQWKNLDPERKAEIKQRFQQYQQLSPELKEKVRRNWKKIKNLPPERRREMAAKYKQWKQLPPDEKRQIRERFHRLKELSPEQRQQLKERREKWQGFAPERKQELREKFRQRVNDRRGGGGRSLEDRPAEARRPFEGDRPRPAAGDGEISDARQKSGGPGPEPIYRKRGSR